MAFRMFEAEPYEESQPGGTPHKAASPDELRAFYHDMERQEAVQRQLTRGKSLSMWARRHSRKAASTPNATPSTQKSTIPTAVSQTPPGTHSEKWAQEEKDKVEEQKEKFDQVPPNATRSIIPDPLGELPAWFSKENKEREAASLPTHRMKYPIHNPIGPRWYNNHHLLPSYQNRSTNRPPSIFSPAFPPMSHPSIERPEDATRPSGTPSGSPLQTPNSSQVKIGDGGKPRSRKTSLTAQDTVDLLDGTDPWGQSWHHQSPYDLGGNASPMSLETPEDGNKSRSPSLTTPTSPSGQTGQSGQSPQSPQNANSRRKTATPSPLSQSTSAASPSGASSKLSRKISSPRKPIAGVFMKGKQPDASSTQPPSQVTPPVVPVPTSPATIPLNSATPTAFQSLKSNENSSKHHSTLPSQTSNASPLSFSSAIPAHARDKKERRGSVLGRLAKKFSILRKSDQSGGSRPNDGQHANVEGGQPEQFRHPSPEKDAPRIAELSKRIPPPPIQTGQSTDTEHARSELPATDTGNRPASVEIAPFSMGKLTIANPDMPSSADSTPIIRDSRLLLDVQVSRSQIEEPPFRTAPEPMTSFEPPPKPLTQPLGTSQTTPTTATAPTNVPSTQSKKVDSQIPPSDDVGLAAPTSSSSRAPTATRTVSTAPAQRSGTIMPPIHSSNPLSVTPNLSTVPLSSDPAVVSLLSSTYTDDSPLSRASMIVNPPTPYPPSSLAMGSTPTSSPPLSTLANPPTPRSSTPAAPAAVSVDSAGPSQGSFVNLNKVRRDSRKKDDDPAKSLGPVASRQTETFRLVRNPSGNALPAGQAIVAAGEHWEVVEATENLRRNKTKERERSSKSNDRETSRREHRRQEKTRSDVEIEDRRGNGHSRQRSTNGRTPDHPGSGSKGQRAHSLDIPVSPEKPETVRTHSYQEDPHFHKRHREDRGRVEDRKGLENGTTSRLNLNKEQPPPPPPSPGPSIVQRRQSRPTSELPSSAELNALRARETWEMDRLHKGRSMHFGAEPNGSMSSPAPVRTSELSNDTNVTLARDNSVQSAGHGSSHTSFLVAAPFQGQPPSNAYYSQIAPPHPTLYSSATQQNSSSSPLYPLQQHTSEPHNNSSNNYQSFSSPPSLSATDTGHPDLHHLLTNPLPPPPRESSYSPSPLPPVLTDSNTGHTAEYWTKYTGMTSIR